MFHLSLSSFNRTISPGFTLYLLQYIKNGILVQQYVLFM